MRSDVNNQFGTAPDGGLFNGPILGKIPASDLQKLSAGTSNETAPQNLTGFGSPFALNSTMTFPIGLPPGETNLALSTSSVGNSSTTAIKRDLTSRSEEEYEALASDLDHTIMIHKNLPRQSSSYWLANVAHGVSPLAPSGYKFFRNVKDYGAVGDGVTEYVFY